MRIFLSLLAILSLSACVSPAEQAVLVRNRASFDFACDPAAIKVTALQTATYGAEGCGNRDVYVVSGGNVYPEWAQPARVYYDPGPRVGVGFGYHHHRYR